MEPGLTPESGRRATDKIPAEIALAIDQAVGETRHFLRNEFAAAHLELSNSLTHKFDELATSLAARNLQDATDHAEVRAQLSALTSTVASLPDVARRVVELESHDRTDNAVAAALAKQQETMEANRRALRNYAIGLASLIVAAAGVLVGVLT